MSCLRSALLALPLTLPATVLASQDFPTRYSSLGVEAGYVDSGNSDQGASAEDDLSNYYEFGLDFTHQFNPNVSLLLQGSYAEPETRNRKLDIDLWRASIGGRLHTRDYRLLGWRPFGGAGYSYTDISADSLEDKHEDALYLEGGLQKIVAPRFLVEAGIRARTELEDGYVDGQYFVGIHYLYSRSFPKAPSPRKPVELASVPEPAPAPPVDTDGDGVPDFRDQCPATPEDALVDTDGCPLQLTRDIHKTLYVEFGFDKTTVSPEYFPGIGELATILRQYPDSTILIEGHTDSIGSSSYNQALSKSRADAVMKVLIDEFGINAKRVTTSGMGESQPVASNDTEEGRAKNRRVEAIISGKYQELQKKSH